MISVAAFLGFCTGDESGTPEPLGEEYEGAMSMDEPAEIDEEGEIPLQERCGTIPLFSFFFFFFLNLRTLLLAECSWSLPSSLHEQV